MRVHRRFSKIGLHNIMIMMLWIIKPHHLHMIMMLQINKLCHYQMTMMTLHTCQYLMIIA